MDASVRADDLQKAVRIGGFELGELAVFEHVAHDGLIAELIEHIGIGAPAGLGLFPAGESELFKKHRAELLRGLDVELFPRLCPDGLAQRVDAARKTSPKARSASASARKPSFSILASTAQSGSSIFVKSSSICASRSLGSMVFSSTATLAAREAISPSRSASVFPLPAGEVKHELIAAVRRAGRGMRREAAIGERELFDLVPGGSRVEKIPGERTVEHPVFQCVHAPREQRALQILHIVPRLTALGRKEQRERRGIAVPVCLRRQEHRERVIFGNVKMRERLAAFGIKPVIGDGVPPPAPARRGGLFPFAASRSRMCHRIRSLPFSPPRPASGPTFQ